MYRVYLLKVNRETVGIAVSKGAKVARFFEMGIEDYDYYEEVACFKYAWMMWAIFLDKYPDLLEVDRYLKKGMAIKVFLKHDGTQESQSPTG
jgi:hypothetical protein